MMNEWIAGADDKLVDHFEGSVKSKQGDWMVKAEPVIDPVAPTRPTVKKGPWVFPPHGIPYRKDSPGDIQPGDVFAIGSEATRLAIGTPEKHARGWRIPSKPALPSGFIGDDRGNIRHWIIRVEHQLLIDSGVAGTIDIGQGICTVKGTFGFATLHDEEPLILSPSFRLASAVGATFLNEEDANIFQQAAIQKLNKRYRMTTVASYLSILERRLRCTPSNIFEITKWNKKTLEAIASI